MRCYDPAEVDDAATSLAVAWRSSQPTEAPSARIEGLNRGLAYELQNSVAAKLATDLGSRVGWKLGLTSRSARFRPFSGPLHQRMVVPSGSQIDLRTTIRPRIEVELALIIGVDLSRDVTVEEIRDVVSVATSFEIIDNRVVDTTRPEDWIADMATMRYAVIGPPSAKPADISTLVGQLSGDKKVLSSGRVDEVVVDPLYSVRWLASHLSNLRAEIRSGDVVLTGSLTGQHTPTPGVLYTGGISGLEPIEVAFA